jgi:5-methyltetrahydrofolate--homocysteine methyltransferase
VSFSHPILSRLDTGKPLLVSGDPAASLRARGIALHGPASLGRLLREHPGLVREHYHQEILAGVDVLSCLTADTIPRALQQIGMPFRSAALTGHAVELALDAAEFAPRPLIVAGVLGNTDVPPLAEDRLREELTLHAERLATAGCELVLARGFGSQLREARHAALVSGAATRLPTWAMATLDYAGFTGDGMSAEEVALDAFEQGAQVALLEIPSAEVGLAHLDRLLVACERSGGGHFIGFALVAEGGHGGGSPAPTDADAWAHAARSLIEAGVRVLGGGHGATSRHLGALSALLRGSERQSLWPRAV